MSCFECPSCKLCRILCIRYMLVAEKLLWGMAQLCAKTSISVIHRLMCVDYQHFFPAQQLFELWFRFLQRNASPQNYLLRVNYERDFVNSIRLSHLRFEIKCAIIIIVQLFAHLKMFDIFFRVRYISTIRSFSCRFLPVYD